MSEIRVVPFQPDYAGDFRRLNLDWIERLFKVEAPIERCSTIPRVRSSDKGGMIFFALDGAGMSSGPSQ